jgi:hypothetical protein
MYGVTISAQRYWIYHTAGIPSSEDFHDGFGNQGLNNPPACTAIQRKQDPCSLSPMVRKVNLMQ